MDSAEISETKLNILKRLNSLRKGNDVIEHITEDNHPNMHILDETDVYKAGRSVLNDSQFFAVMNELINTLDVKTMVELTLVDSIGFSGVTRGLIKFLADKYSGHNFASYILDLYRNFVTWFVVTGFIPLKYIRAGDVHWSYNGSGSRGQFSGKTYDPHVVNKYVSRNMKKRDEVVGETMKASYSTLPTAMRMLLEPHFEPATVEIVVSYMSKWVQETAETQGDDVDIKLGAIGVWEFMKTMGYGFLPYIPTCDLETSYAAYDSRTDTLVVGLAPDDLYPTLVWRSDPGRGTVKSYAQESAPITAQWSNIVNAYMKICSNESGRKIYTTRATANSKKKQTMDLLTNMGGLASTADQARRQLSRLIVHEHQNTLNGITPGLDTVGQNKLESVSAELADELSNLVKTSEESAAVKSFLSSVIGNPYGAYEKLTRSTASKEALMLASRVTQAIAKNGASAREDPAEMIGDDVDLLCQYNSNISVSEVEEALAAWLTYWRSKLTGGQSGYNQRKNVIQYAGSEQKTTKGPSLVIESLFLTTLNKSGTILKNIHKPPHRGLTITDILMLNQSISPSAMALILSAQLGIRPADVLLPKPPEESEEPSSTQRNVGFGNGAAPPLDKRFVGSQQGEPRYQQRQEEPQFAGRGAQDGLEHRYRSGHRRDRSPERRSDQNSSRSSGHQRYRSRSPLKFGSRREPHRSRPNQRSR